MSRTAIIVAAGRGTRMGLSSDKLFVPLAGKPLVAHTWGRFDGCGVIDEIVVVGRPESVSDLGELASRYGFRKPFRVVAGGAERQDSVWNGLEALSVEAEIVAIQDGARPCTSEALIVETVRVAEEMGAAVAAQRIVDTIKESDGGSLVERTVERSRLWAVQTPQTFRVEVIRRALRAVREAGARVTDDTAACEWIGQPVRLVESQTPNPKATTPADLKLIEALL